MWKTTGSFFHSWRIKLALESYFEERALETWERNLRKTTLLNMNDLKLVETHLHNLCEQFKDDDQRKTVGEIAGSVPETSLEWKPILKERGGFWKVNDGYLLENRVLTASPDSRKDWWHNQSPC